ncbi:MAG TPA: 30S ribosome-binding factor RbfA [bacterium (Candidatus Stahlbacteria)]|nr:30S ribosome-binding factor RbfA [Candidatus Stahlbacteria bacterium]
MKNRRALRVGSLIKKEVALIIEKELKNANKEFISVIDVKIGNDLRTATIYIRALGSEKRALEILQKARKFIRYKLSKRVSLRFIPEIKFKLEKNMPLFLLFVSVISIFFNMQSHANTIGVGMGYFVPYGNLATVLSTGKELKGEISIKEPLFCMINFIYFKNKDVELELSQLGLGLSFRLHRVFLVQGGLGFYWVDIGYEFDKHSLLFMGITFPIVKSQNVGINLSTFWYSNIPRGLSLMSSVSLNLFGDKN